VEPLRKKERQGETREHFTRPLFANVLSCRFFKNLTLCMTKLRVVVLSFPDFTDISVVFDKFGKFLETFAKFFV